jgi:hypothetical protein
VTTPDTTTLLAQLRAVLDLTNTEIQVAETRIAQARTEVVRRELSQNADNGRARAEAIESAIRELGGYPDVIGPFIGRAAAAVKRLPSRPSRSTRRFLETSRSNINCSTERATSRRSQRR